MSNYHLALLLSLTLFALSTLSRAQNSPADFLRAHNDARAQVGVGPMRWDSTVAGVARAYANKLSRSCAMIHSGGPYGENLAWGSADLPGTDAVKMWVDEQQFYNYGDNSCADGEVCGHYTQVVWRDSVRLGCAKVQCSSFGTIIVCNYDPPGNWVGEWPFEAITSSSS